MGRMKDLWMTWQDKVATPEQLELSVAEQLELVNEWIVNGYEEQKNEEGDQDEDSE